MLLFKAHQTEASVDMNKGVAALRSLGYWTDWGHLEMCVSCMALALDDGNGNKFDLDFDSD